MRAHLYDSLDEIAEELRVSPSFISFARAIDKEFSLCANYPKGHGAIFQEWMKDNHPGELLLHVERALSGGRQDIASMAAMAIYWNRNYYVEFLDEMKTYSDKDDNILVNNLHAMLISSEMVSVARLWSILHISLVMPMRYLVANTHKWAALNWGEFKYMCSWSSATLLQWISHVTSHHLTLGPISLGRVLDKLKDDLESIVDQTELIHDEAFMMGMMTPWSDIIPDFEEYLHHQFHVAKQRKVNESGSWAVPLEEVRRELFHPRDQDNKESTALMEELAKVACLAWKAELVDPTKATFQYLSESKSEYSYDHCKEDVKKALLGSMAVNDLAESSFAGVTSVLQKYGRIGLAHAAGVSDLARNDFLSRDEGATDGRKGMFHRLPEELQLTAVMCAIKFAPSTRNSNSTDLERQHQAKREKQELKKKAGFANASDEYIECLIHHTLWSSERCWKTPEDVREGLKSLDFKCDKEAALKDNINIRFKGFGWDDCRVTWSKDGVKKTIPDLKSELLDIMKRTKGRAVPSTPASNIPRRKNTNVLGTMTKFQRGRDDKKTEEIDDHDQSCRRQWRDREASGKGSMLADMQKQVNKRKMDNVFVNRRIESLTEYTITNSDGSTKSDLIWCGALVESVCDGTWARTGKSGKRLKTCYKEGEAAHVLWDAVEATGEPAQRQLIEIKPAKWNGNEAGAWRFELGKMDYGIRE